MLRASFLALALAAPTRLAAPPAVVRAVAAALAVPGGRVEVSRWEASLPAGCEPSEAEASRPVAASGPAALRVRGRGGSCQGWGWAEVHVFAPALLAARPIREGEPLGPAAALAEREVLRGRAPLAELPAGAVAARPIAAGTVLEPGLLRVGPRPGEPLPVILRTGALTVEQAGRAVACARGRACALLPGGRRVEGRLEGGRLVVEAP